MVAGGLDRSFFFALSMRVAVATDYRKMNVVVSHRGMWLVGLSGELATRLVSWLSTGKRVSVGSPLEFAIDTQPPTGQPSTGNEPRPFDALSRSRCPAKSARKSLIPL